MRNQTRQLRTQRFEWIAPSGAFIARMFYCVLLLMTAQVPAEDKSVTRGLVDELIRGLDANTLAERSRSERQLLELGPEVLSLLPPPELIESVSAREAVRRIRPQLERRAARESSAGSHVSLRGEYSLREVLDQIERQTRNRVSLTDNLHDAKERRLRVDWDQALFWNCLDDLGQQGRFRWQFAKDEPAIRIFQLDEPQPNPLCVQRTGAFRIAIDNVEIRAVVGDELQRLLRVKGRISVEPRLRPLFLSLTAKNLKATTDENRPLSAWNPEAKYEFPVGDGGREMPVRWDFRLPVGMKATSVSIRGQLRCQIAAATERVVFDQKSLTRGTVRRRGGVSVRLRHVAFEADDADKLNGDIGITVSYDNGGPAFESHRSWIFHNAVYLETKAGVRTNFTDFETTQQSDGAVAVDYRWKMIAPPSNQYLFVYEAPTLIIDVPVDVDLGNISVVD